MPWRLRLTDMLGPTWHRSPQQPVEPGQRNDRYDSSELDVAAEMNCGHQRQKYASKQGERSQDNGAAWPSRCDEARGRERGCCQPDDAHGDEQTGLAELLVPLEPPPLLQEGCQPTCCEPQIGAEDETVCWRGAPEQDSKLEDRNRCRCLECEEKPVVGGRAAAEGQEREESKRQEAEKVLEDSQGSDAHLWGLTNSVYLPRCDAETIHGASRGR